MFDFLKTFNEKVNDCMTLSSCSGRILVAETERLSFSKGKGMFKVLAKWHRPITLSELLRVINSRYSNVWIIVTGGIIHFSCRFMDKALEILDIAQKTGFKHSGIISIRDDEVIIEVQGEEKLSIPVIINRRWILDKNSLSEVIDIINETLILAKIRLTNLVKLIEIKLMKRSDVKFNNRKSFKGRTYREFKELLRKVKLAD
ncbi:MAG: hypothetical protein B6V02_02070 [Thermoprotei archaeon ex4572_64]|nr:MAG: hypothetical protein B6V02_02070 [Thermoprotei archaeon ex4572_64]